MFGISCVRQHTIFQPLGQECGSLIENEQGTLMKITFLGHASFRIEMADQTLLIDPWSMFRVLGV